MIIEKISENKVFGGRHIRYQHQSGILNCAMQFAIFIPSSATVDRPAPCLYWLSGLTCTDENFMQKAGAFKKAQELRIIIVAPDTSPRGDDVANDDNYDLGQGAGFYLNATQPPWESHFQTYDYITEELPALINSNFETNGKMAIAGHSMGGHGALTIGVKNQDRYTSISAFSPICNPMDCPWGQKAFTSYLGLDKNAWSQYDACELLREYGCSLPILIDQGDADNFLDDQLKPQRLAEAAKLQDVDLQLRMQSGYDHSYFFIASFIEQHLTFHHAFLKQ